MDQVKIGNFIASERKHKNLTQKQLAELLNVSDKTISKWENGKSIPDTEYLDSLCKILEISLSELLSGDKIADSDYPHKAEETIMALFKENEHGKAKNTATIIIGILILIATILLMLLSTIDGRTGIWLYAALFIDAPSLILIILLCTGLVLISKARALDDILRLLNKIILPVSLFITLFGVVIVLQGFTRIEQLCPSLAVAALSFIYGLAIKIVIVLWMDKRSVC